MTKLFQTRPAQPHARPEAARRETRIIIITAIISRSFLFLSLFFRATASSEDDGRGIYGAVGRRGGRKREVYRERNREREREGRKGEGEERAQTAKSLANYP